MAKLDEPIYVFVDPVLIERKELEALNGLMDLCRAIENRAHRHADRDTCSVDLRDIQSLNLAVWGVEYERLRRKELVPQIVGKT